MTEYSAYVGLDVHPGGVTMSMIGHAVSMEDLAVAIIDEIESSNYMGRGMTATC